MRNKIKVIKQSMKKEGVNIQIEDKKSILYGKITALLLMEEINHNDEFMHDYFTQEELKIIKEHL